MITPRKRTLIMGVMNITPDSFYDGGHYIDPAAANKRARQLIEDGADILDIGGESSRPGAKPVSSDEELRRILPVIAHAATLPARISVDTYHAKTAREALAAGAFMINDITALRGDPEMAQVVAESGCPCVLMHMQGTPLDMQRAPAYDDVIDAICAFLEERIAFARDSGIAESQLWLDPGFGFGKTVAHNLTLLRRLGEFTRFGLPILVGTSNKSTIGAILDTEVDDRREGTAATVALAIREGAACVRVHDVKSMARVARMTDAIVHGTVEDK